MKAIETIKEVMKVTGTTLSDLEKYSDLGSLSNISQMLNRNDLKVGTFVEMLEVMGFQLIAQSGETDNEIIVDNDERWTV